MRRAAGIPYFLHLPSLRASDKVIEGKMTNCRSSRPLLSPLILLYLRKICESSSSSHQRIPPHKQRPLFPGRFRIQVDEQRLQASSCAFFPPTLRAIRCSSGKYASVYLSRVHPDPQSQ